MRGIFKRALSMIMCFVMVFTMMQGTMIGASAKVVGPDSKTELTISTDKSKYSWGDTIIFNITVKNVTNETLRGIKINSFAREITQIAQQGDSPIISELKPGESKTVQIEYFATKLASFIIIFMPIFWLFSPAGRIAYREANFNYEQKVKIGLFRHKVGFEVTYNNDIPQETVNVIYNLSDVVVNDFPKSQIVIKGEVPQEPEIPVSEGNIFDGWFTSEDYDQPFYFEHEIYDDIIVYAKWHEKIDNISDLILDNPTYTDLFKQVSKFNCNNDVDNVKVEYWLKGGVGDLSISYSSDANIARTAGLIGRPIDISLLSDNELEKAIITFSYNKEDFGEDVDESKLSVFWYDEENDALTPIESTVDTETHTVSAETNHFSQYLLVNTTKWAEAWEHKQMVSRDTGKSLRYNICLCLDVSGSMSGNKITTCQNSAKMFVDQLVEGDSIAVVSFNSYATTLVYPTVINGDSGKEAIKSQITLNANGGTNFDNALNSSIALLNEMADHSTDYEIYKKYIVLISDGQSSANASTISQLVKNGYNVITIGIGNGVSESVLRSIAEQTSGSYAFVSDPNNIASVFQQIQGEYIGLVQDSDGDNIADLVETSGMIATDGYIYKTDPNDNDTDGDGISDSEEMGIYDDVKGCFIINSSPTTPTYRSNSSKVSVKIGLSSVNSYSINPDLYKTQKCTIQLSAAEREYPELSVGGQTIVDYSSETKYADAKNIVIHAKTTQGLDKSFSIKDINAGDSVTKVFSLSVDDLSKSSGKLTISVSGKNFETVTQEINYNFLDSYFNFLDSTIISKETALRDKGTKAVRAVAQLQKEAEKKIDDMVVLTGGPLTIGSTQNIDAIKQELQTHLAKIYKQKAEEYATSKKSIFSSYDAEDVIKDVARQFKSESAELTFNIGSIEYKATIDDISYMYAGFGQISVTASNGQSFYFGYSSSMEQAQSALTDYMDACKVLANKSLKACIDAALSDAGKILEIDYIRTLVEGKCGEIVDRYLLKNGFSFTYNDLKTGYKYYDTAKSAVDKCKSVGGNPSQKRIDSAMKSVEALINFNF